jgi:hypothetical protein
MSITVVMLASDETVELDIGLLGAVPAIAQSG